MNKDKIKWSALEYEYKKKSADWFWTFSIITLTVIVVSIMFDNFLFAAVIALSAFLVIIYSFRPPRTIVFEANRSGIVIEKILYPYASLESFWVEENDRRPKLLIKPKKKYMPHVIMPIEGIESHEVRDFLDSYIPQIEDHEPVMQKIMEHFGF